MTIEEQTALYDRLLEIGRMAALDRINEINALDEETATRMCEAAGLIFRRATLKERRSALARKALSLAGQQIHTPRTGVIIEGRANLCLATVAAESLQVIAIKSNGGNTPAFSPPRPPLKPNLQQLLSTAAHSAKSFIKA